MITPCALVFRETLPYVRAVTLKISGLAHTTSHNGASHSRNELTDCETRANDSKS